MGKMGWGEKGVRRPKLPFIKYLSPKDVMYGMVTIINNAILDTCKLLIE